MAFLLSITLVLLFQYRLEIVKNIEITGFPVITGGFLLMLANLLFIQALANTSIANTLFTLSSIPFFTAIMGFIFLKEELPLRTIIMMIAAFIGIYLMIKGGLESGSFFGNFLAIVCAITFSGYVIVLRKFRNINMLPANMVSGILVILVSFVISLGNMKIPTQEILLCFLWGGVLSGFVNSVFIFSTRYLLASEATFIMLLEFSLGPFWVWIFLNETISRETFYGGAIVIISVGIYSFLEFKNKKITADSTY